MITSGKHLEAVRGWIQWNAFNGSQVRWNSDEFLKLKSITVKDLEQLAQKIRDAVLNEMEVKPPEHKYKFVVVCEEGCAAFQDFDTPQELWNCLFRAEGRVGIYRKGFDETIFSGSANEAREWARGVKEL